MVQAYEFDLSPAEARSLLRKLRDLNLAMRHVAVSRETSVSIEGCLSLDAPAEQGVRYRVVTAEGAHVLTLDSDTGGLAASLSESASKPPTRTVRLELARDGAGRATSPKIAARVALESTDPREVEHFLRRIVRALFAPS